MKGLRPSVMLHCVTELVVSDVLKEHGAFIFKGPEVEKDGLLYP
jgi:hypothetical protein